ncbi:MAG: ATP-binding protein [Promethearchaeota archaeon]
MNDRKFWIGKFSKIEKKIEYDKFDEMKRSASDFRFDSKILFRHAGIFGSTGSGKTVLGKIICEEAALNQIPVIAIDPQGDIAALKLIGDENKLKEKGIPQEAIDKYKNQVEVRIYTPSSKKGLTISINPINIPEKTSSIEEEDIIKLLDNQSKILVKILIKVAKLSSRYVSPAEAAIYTVLYHYFNQNKKINSLHELAKIIELEEDIGIEDFLDDKQRKRVAIAIKTLSVGSTRLLLSEGDEINIDKLLESVADGNNKKTPVNIFFLKSIYTNDEREFFLSMLVNELYSWMIRQGQAKKPRCIFFCDEIAPFIPAGAAKPGPKDALLLLFRQARKYGIQCIIATQSPKDVDYHAYEQFNTFFIGRITSQQSLKVLQKILSGFPEENKINKMLNLMPVLKSGQFFFISPDNPIPYALIFTRWLITDHRTLTLEDVRKIVEGTYLTPEQAEILRKKKEAEERRKKEEEERLKRDAEIRRKREEELRRKKAEEEKRRKLEEEKIRREELKRKREEERKKMRESISKMPVEKLKAEIEKPVNEFDESIPDDLTYRIIMHKIFDRLKKISKSEYGLDFLRNLVVKRKLPDEYSMMTYFEEYNTVLKAKLAKVKGKYLVFDFKTMIKDIIKELGIKISNLNDLPLDKLEAIFYRLLNSKELKKVLSG